MILREHEEESAQEQKANKQALEQIGNPAPDQELHVQPVLNQNWEQVQERDTEQLGKLALEHDWEPAQEPHRKPAL